MAADLPGDPPPSREQAVRELLSFAQDELRRGVKQWFDPELASELRDLMRGAPRDAAVTVAPSRAPSQNLSPPEPSAAVPAVSASIPKTNRPAWGPPPQAVGRDADWEAQLAAVREEAMECRRCGLCETRTKVVFSAGTCRVPLVFVGEAPGADEDRQGFPFVGRAGQLLTKIIEAIGLTREDVYICNVLKCRPPENRNPAPDEIVACSPFLSRQLAILKPKVICALGLFAAQRLTGQAIPIGKLRGRWFEYEGIPLLPTYHPAALLRNPALKATVWEDVQLLRRRLDEPVPPS